ncbi:hypothetical protein GW17_00019933 [Ensete ventricosum]|nr:hypothetical protein GW17_00019933 [Ensete ventricosum]
MESNWELRGVLQLEQKIEDSTKGEEIQHREDIDFLLPTTRLQGTATFCWSASSSARSILHAAATAFGDHGLPSILSRLVTELFGLWFGDTGDIRSL